MFFSNAFVKGNLCLTDTRKFHDLPRNPVEDLRFPLLKDLGSTNGRSGSSTYLCSLRKTNSFTALPIENVEKIVITCSEKQLSSNSAAMFVRGVAHQSVTCFSLFFS